MPEEKRKNRLLGAHAGRTLLQLAVASIVVGAIFTFIGLSPREFWRGVFEGVRRVAGAIGDSFGEIAVNLATYLLIGAAIVVPIWLIARLLSGRRK